MSCCICAFWVCAWLYTWKQRVRTRLAAVHRIVMLTSLPAW